MLGTKLLGGSTIRSLAECENRTKSFSTISFDLFDTLVYRGTINRWEIQKLLSEYAVCALTRFRIFGLDADSFIATRARVTKNIKAKSVDSSSFEPPLELVIREVLKQYQAPAVSLQSLTKELLDFELSLEISSLRVMNGATELLKLLSAQNKTLIVITDMYISKQGIEKILSGLDLLKYFDEVFVSSEYGATKRGGSLFPVVLNALDLDPSSVIHIGDNYKSDVQSASRYALAALYFKPEGAKVKVADENHLASINVSLANVVTSFLVRLAFHASALELKRIYFLSRDATVLARCIQYGLEHNKFLAGLLRGVEVRDLSLNRYTSLYLDIDFDNQPLAKILDRSIKLFPQGFSLRQLSECFGMDCGDLDVDSFLIMPNSNFEAAAEELRAKAHDFIDMLVSAVRDHSETTVNYLQQESVVGTADRVAIVDLGYEGSIVNSISRFSKLSSSQTQFNFYHVLFCAPPEFKNRKDPNGSFGSSAIDQSGLDSLLRLNFSWLEVFFQDSNRGPLIGYSQSNAELTPQFSNSQCKSETLPWVQFCKDQLANNTNLEEFMTPAFLDRSVDDFVSSMNSPSEATLSRLSEYEYASGLLDDVRKPIVRDNLVLKACLRLASVRELVANEVWLSGSLYASGLKWLRPVLSMAFACYFFAKRCLFFFHRSVSKSS